MTIKTTVEITSTLMSIPLNFPEEWVGKEVEIDIRIVGVDPDDYIVSGDFETGITITLRNKSFS